MASEVNLAVEALAHDRLHRQAQNLEAGHDNHVHDDVLALRGMVHDVARAVCRSSRVLGDCDGRNDWRFRNMDGQRD